MDEVQRIVETYAPLWTPEMGRTNPGSAEGWNYGGSMPPQVITDNRNLFEEGRVAMDALLESYGLNTGARDQAGGLALNLGPYSDMDSESGFGDSPLGSYGLQVRQDNNPFTSEGGAFFSTILTTALMPALAPAIAAATGMSAQAANVAAQGALSAAGAGLQGQSLSDSLTAGLTSVLSDLAPMAIEGIVDALPPAQMTTVDSLIGKGIDAIESGGQATLEAIDKFAGELGLAGNDLLGFTTDALDKTIAAGVSPGAQGFYDVLQGAYDGFIGGGGVTLPDGSQIPDQGGGGLLEPDGGGWGGGDFSNEGWLEAVQRAVDPVEPEGDGPPAWMTPEWAEAVGNQGSDDTYVNNSGDLVYKDGFGNEVVVEEGYTDKPIEPPSERTNEDIWDLIGAIGDWSNTQPKTPTKEPFDNQGWLDGVNELIKQNTQTPTKEPFDPDGWLDGVNELIEANKPTIDPVDPTAPSGGDPGVPSGGGGTGGGDGTGDGGGTGPGDGTGDTPPFPIIPLPIPIPDDNDSNEPNTPIGLKENIWEGGYETPDYGTVEQAPLFNVPPRTMSPPMVTPAANSGQPSYEEWLQDYMKSQEAQEGLLASIEGKRVTGGLL
jgi:hypothetical protein